MLQRDGKILLIRSPQTTLGLLRLNADGPPDASFGASGVMTTTVKPYFNSPQVVEATSHAVAVQLNGKIIVGGSYISPSGSRRNLLLVRYNGTPVDILNTHLPLAPH